MKWILTGWHKFFVVHKHKKIFMKKKMLSFTICLSAALIWSCNNSGNNTTSNSDSTTGATDTTNTMTGATANNTSSAPFSMADSAFVIEAATANMMEVQTGQLAQQQASNPRVKDFGNMMVTDHGQANDQLKSLVSGRINLSDSLPADKRKEMDHLKALNGTAFDKKYVSMMVEDHQKDVAKFKSEANKVDDPQLKQWVQNTVPVLQKHLDSIQAIKKDLHY
jgi:putative membrane protein